MRNFIEWFLMLFIRKKAEKVREEAIRERLESIEVLANIKKANDKFLSKFSGRKRYVKTGKI